ncbi:beta strand repeat-containing protein [Hymenobacter psychrophilus]|uniref:Por secretion system C-terminal sorting domain-containing protein n=1 Tax=Hymenobacter psychrophilus TaxID=651662 RepID=A0A1H3KI56_9BACT|nr:T9SS type A sorting domain-containing protein [Hymenobacter psychrophilus]SDY51288.1 Por secretion system C-terminal sorting domain-containing protein [Hymenobacter psychrophilus]
MAKTLLSSPATPAVQLLAGWRPALLLTLGLLPALPTSAQQRPLLKPVETATRVTLPAPSVQVAAPVVAPRRARRAPLAAISSTATGGNWSDPASWVGGTVPTATDDVTIVAGATVTLDVAASAASLTVAATGSLLNSATTSYSLAVGGNVTNNGTLDLSADPAIGSDLRFTGAGNATFGGSGITDLQSLTLAKAVRADVVELDLPTLSVKGSTSTGDGFLLTRTTGATPADDMTGTLKISGTATISNKVFGNAASYVIPATGGFWLNNSNFTVAGQTGSATVSGLLRISAGAYNVGTAAGNSLTLGTASVLTVEGGVLTSAGRVTSFTSATAAAATTFTLSGGTINVANVGNASGTPSFGINGVSNVSGGVINLVQRSTATTPLDYYVAGTYNFTGGTVNVGTAATATNFDFRIRGSFPNLTVDNTTNPKSALMQGQTNVYGTTLVTAGATLNLNGQLLLQFGATIANNGTLTGTAANSTIYFAGSVPQTVGGTGIFTTIRSLTLDNDGGGLTLNVPLVVTRVNLFTGNLNGTSNLTIGDGSAIFFAVQIGVTGNTTTSGSFTSAPTFNIGNGGYQLIYNSETTNRTTGLEVPTNRLTDVVVINNPSGVTVAGGNLLVGGSTTSSLVLTNGILTTSAANTVIIGSAAPVIPTGSAISYVNGPLGLFVNSTTAVNRTFAVGDAAGWRPVVVTGITTTASQLFTATVVKAATGGTLSGGLSSLNPTRYVRLQNSAALPATARMQLSYGTDDVLGAPATTVVAQAATAGGSYASLGGAPATVPTTGIISTQDLTPGNDFFVLANTEGGTLTSSVAAVCAGSNTGTITLTGNTGTVTGYEADSGNGFVAVAGTNTGSTYTFTNLTVTTTFRAVLTTADGRTVYSAPVTVTVNPATTATFTYASATFCQSGTNPTPTITGTAGGTFSSTTGLVINATTGVIDLAASTTGTYVVTYSVGGNCPSSATFSVTVTAPATAGFSYASTAFCTSNTGTRVPVLTTGATAGTFSSTTGLSLDAATGAITPGTSTPGTYVVTNTVAASGGCATVTATFSVTITAPATAGFSYASANYCVGATNPSPVLATGASAGTFSSTTGLVISATGVINLSTSTAGTYVVTNTVAASGACAAVTATFSVTINARPAQPTVSVQYNGPVTTLTSSAATGNQWLLNGTAIAGATNPTYVVNSAAQLGSYTVTTTNAAGCTSLPSAPLVVTSSSQPLAGSSLQLYPNPTTDGLLTVKLGGYNKAVELTVYNAVGQQVRTLSVPAGRLEQPLDLSQLPNGVYVLKARTEGGLDVRRIVKQ